MEDAQCVVLDNSIIIAGSIGNEKNYILENGKWKEFIKMPFTPSIHAVAKVDNCLFAFNCQNIYTLESGHKKWKELNVKSKKRYVGHRIVAKDGFIFITFRKRWDVFDARKKAWLFAKDDMA